ncbi:MAG TPA: tetraacyldisaccharide 4'-kinase [Macromonas sp.]|nr:tetraacyldisaccharide 4'-kinase [Macromonas sp.]
MSARLLRTWQTRNALSCLLWPMSLLYQGLLALRRLLYRSGIKTSTRLPVPVLVVGNVVVGGAGKTPTVIQLVEHLRARGWTPGVISRGHGRSSDGCTVVTAQSPAQLVGDEPALIARRTQAPMVVGRQRVQAGHALLAQHPGVDIIVSDDGMQHWDLARDLTVVVFDERGTGNGWLLPAGLLREPWPARPWTGSRMLVLHNTTGVSEAGPLETGQLPVFRATRRLQPVAVAPDGTQCPLAELPRRCANRPLAALAGIARPEAFFAMLRGLGVPLSQTLALPDHADADTLAAALSPDKVWLCTEKDAVKLRSAPPAGSLAPQVWAVPLVQTPEPAFFQAIDAALDGLSSAHGRQTP